jgi:peptidyl-prolyl cis-trans isomerase B (cyclophilin B)
VIAGMEEVDRIVNAKRNFRDKPLEDQRMQRVTVNTFGVEYGEAEKI